MAKLNDSPLWQNELIPDGIAGITIKTVHRAKGESIDAVLYIAKPKDITNLLAGPVSKEGRIGYVAVTRARDLLILGVPEKTPIKTINALESKGFAVWK